MTSLKEQGTLAAGERFEEALQERGEKGDGFGMETEKEGCGNEEIWAFWQKLMCMFFSMGLKFHCRVSMFAFLYLHFIVRASENPSAVRIHPRHILHGMYHRLFLNVIMA